MKLLMTGATGFLGSNLARALLAEGHDVVILKRSTSQCARIADIRERVTTYDIDCVPLDVPFRVHAPFDAIFHAATCYGRAKESHWEIFSVNTVLPLQLLGYGAEHGCRLFVNADTSLHRSLNAYTLSKKQFVEWGQLASLTSSLHFVNLVLEHFYGPGDDAGKITTALIRNCLDNIPSMALTRGEQERDFIYIDDAVAAYITVLRSVASLDASFTTYEIGSGETVTIKALAEHIRQLTGSVTRLDFGAVPYRENEVMLSRADIAALVKLGWKPRVGLDEGLRRTIDFERKKRMTS